MTVSNPTQHLKAMNGGATVPPTLLCTVKYPANTGFAWDFIERSYARLADRLATRGVRTIVAYPEISEAPKPLNGSSALPVVLDTQLKTRRSRAGMAEFVRRENVQVVYFTERPMYSPWYRTVRSAGARKIIVHNHTSGALDAPSGIRRVAKRAVISMPGVAADVVVAVSDFVADLNRAVSLIDPSRIRRVWNGIDPIPEGSEDGLPELRSTLGLDVDTPVVGCACRATAEKGVDLLFQAFDRYKSKSRSNAVLVYAGTGPQFEELSELRDTLSSAQHIHMMGYVPSAASLFRTASVCVVPSFRESFSLAVLEMMVRGRAVIAARVGGVPEVIEDGVSGILIPARDIGSLTCAIGRVLETPSLQASLGRAARDRASSLFTGEQQISEMLGTFHEVFEGSA